MVAMVLLGEPDRVEPVRASNVSVWGHGRSS